MMAENFQMSTMSRKWSFDSIEAVATIYSISIYMINKEKVRFIEILSPYLYP